MASSMELPQAPLKGKLHQVKYLLEDANKRLQKEMANCEIFTTKTSAATCSSNMEASNGSNNISKELPADLRRTISDISALNSVLSCPIFNRIVNVADSLDKLSYHLNLHPSIGPADINIDANGELILAPPIEPTSLNNLINSKLDEYSNDSMISPLIMNSNLVHNNSNNQTPTLEDHQGHHLRNQQQHQQQQQQQQFSDITLADISSSNGFVQQLIKEHEMSNRISHQQQQHNAQRQAGSYAQPIAMNVYDNEKLIKNRLSKTQFNGNKRHQDATRADAQEMDERQRLYNSNGHFNFDLALSSQPEMRDQQFRSTQSMNDQIGEQQATTDPNRNGYSNELYKTTHELNQPESIKAHQQQQRQHISLNQTNGQSYNNKVCNKTSATTVTTTTTTTTTAHNVYHLNNHIANGKTQSIQNSLNYNRSSCSPSTSAGSTVRLADECDSGASSLNQPVPVSRNGGNLYSPQVYKMNDQVMLLDENHTTSSTAANLEEERMDSLERDLLSPEMERIKVTLEKDETGLGITIAGYTCEKEEISGIFIKSITPNSPADRSGRVRTLDQIFAVNGRELLGYNNKEAVEVLRHTGKVVTLELMRYLAESKFQKLQTALAHAVPTMNNSSSKSETTNFGNAQTINDNNNISSMSPTKSAIPVSISPTKPPLLAKPAALVQSTKNFQATSLAASTTIVPPTQQQQQNVESIYKNDIVPTNLPTDAAAAPAKRTSISQVNSPQLTPDLQSHIPVAAQRGSGAIKVIETKQGARNTIDIRSPVCKTTTTPPSPFYVNNNKIVAANDQYDSAKKVLTNRGTQNETPDDFGKLFRSLEPEWENETQIIEICKDSSQSLGFTVKDYVNPKDPKRSIIMITALTPGGIAEKDGRLSLGDLLIFVDDINLEGASLNEAVRAFQKTSGVVTLGVLKLKRTLT